MIAGELDGQLHRLHIAVADKQTAELLGMVGLDWAEDIADLRIAIRAESRGHGLGREALAGVLAWTRDTTHLNHVMGVTDTDNADSADMMLAIGMVETFEPAGDLHGAEVVARTFAWER
jgi:RimJ/RimL family protein N-acetyltransferase